MQYSILMFSAKLMEPVESEDVKLHIKSKQTKVS